MNFLRPRGSNFRFPRNQISVKMEYFYHRRLDFVETKRSESLLCLFEKKNIEDRSRLIEKIF